MQNEYRKQIDEIDRKLVKLFCERMEISGKIGKYKKENGLPILDKNREAEKLKEVKGLSNSEYESYLEKLYGVIFELSRDYQAKITDSTNGG